MKKLGILVFIVAIIVGVVFASFFSYGRVSGKIFSFSIGKSIRGSGVEAAQTRTPADFTSVEVGGVFQVDIKAGKDLSVEVSADDNLLQYITTEVHDGVLKISTSERLKSRSPIRVRVSAPNIERIEASGASEVNVAGISNSELSLDSSGASRVRVTGETRSLNVEVSGASNLDANGLKTSAADVQASGASHVSISVSDNLIAHASGASSVSYAGSPGRVEKSSSGASKITQK